MTTSKQTKCGISRCDNDAYANYRFFFVLFGNFMTCHFLLFAKKIDSNKNIYFAFKSIVWITSKDAYLLSHSANWSSLTTATAQYWRATVWLIRYQPQQFISIVGEYRSSLLSFFFLFAKYSLFFGNMTKFAGHKLNRNKNTQKLKCKWHRRKKEAVFWMHIETKIVGEKKHTNKNTRGFN